MTFAALGASVCYYVKGLAVVCMSGPYLRVLFRSCLVAAISVRPDAALTLATATLFKPQETPSGLHRCQGQAHRAQRSFTPVLQRSSVRAKCSSY